MSTPIRQRQQGAAPPHQHLGGSWRALGIDELIEERQRAIDNLESFETSSQPLFPRSWFPISAWLTGPLLCIDTDDDAGALFEYDPESGSWPDPTNPEFPNIVSFLEAVTFLVANGYSTWLGPEEGFQPPLHGELPEEFRFKFSTPYCW